MTKEKLPTTSSSLTTMTEGTPHNATHTDTEAGQDDTRLKAASHVPHSGATTVVRTMKSTVKHEI